MEDASWFLRAICSYCSLAVVADRAKRVSTPERGRLPHDPDKHVTGEILSMRLENI